MVKCCKVLVAVLLIPSMLFMFLLSISPTTFASDTENALVRQLEDALAVSILHQKGTDRLIKCFDVNDSGWYAIGFKNNTIHVYDSFGIFQYGYQFNTDGTYGIVLKENSIVIYLVRSDNAVEIDPTGKCLNADKIYFSKEILDNIIYRTDKQIGNVRYYLERDIGIFHGDYSRLIKSQQNETKTILYDVTVKGYFAGACHYIILSIFPLASIIFFATRIKKERCETEDNSAP